MKNKLYAGILSASLSGCAAQTTFVDYPVVVEQVKGVYTRDSNDNCYLKIPEREGWDWKLYDENCDQTVDTVALSSQERFLFQHDRQDLNQENRQFFDALFQKTIQYQDTKRQRRDYHDLLF